MSKITVSEVTSIEIMATELKYVITLILLFLNQTTYKHPVTAIAQIFIPEQQRMKTHRIETNQTLSYCLEKSLMTGSPYIILSSGVMYKVIA